MEHVKDTMEHVQQPAACEDTECTHVTLAAGIQMPVLGLGTFQGNGEEVRGAVDAALNCGYRMIDTAFSYQNEADIGHVIHEKIKAKKIKRQDLFVISKLAGVYMGDVRRGLEKSLSLLQLDYIDLYLIHTPMGFKFKNDEDLFPADSTDFVHNDFVAAWKILEDLVDEGKICALGVSNFSKEQIECLTAHARHPVSVQQVECHAYFRQDAMLDFCKNRNIVMMSFASMGSPATSFIENCGLLKDAVVGEIARAHGKSPAQILLKNQIQRGICVIPKSVNPSRIRENMQVFDFELTSEEMLGIEKIDRGERLFTFLNFYGHPEFPFDDVIPP